MIQRKFWRLRYTRTAGHDSGYRSVFLGSTPKDRTVILARRGITRTWRWVK